MRRPREVLRLVTDDRTSLTSPESGENMGGTCRLTTLHMSLESHVHDDFAGILRETMCRLFGIDMGSDVSGEDLLTEG